MANTKDETIKYGSYRRKSTDDERQVLSLESQESEIKGKFFNLKIVDFPPESVSAFKPYKRPIFKKMMEMIEAGKIQGIVAWHPDRLSRNPIDAAQIIYFLDIGKLKDLKFCSYNFENTAEGKMLLQIVMSQSKYSSDKLSTDVKRGLKKKASTGWRPCLAPLGYKNSKTKLKGEQDYSNDEMRFSLVKQLWQKMLTGNYTVPEILKFANNELKLTQPATPRRPERKLYLSTLYRIFGNPLYYGWYEWPEGSGNWIKGNHETMITEEEFDQVQKFLGRRGRPRPQKHRFSFTGLMRCPCGAGITAEEKFKKQKNGNVHHYIYYHCTRKIKPDCVEKAIEIKEFNERIDGILAKLNISERFQKWALQYLHEIRKEEARTQQDVLVVKQRTLEKTTEKLENLLLKYISPENAENKLITEQEFVSLKSHLLKEKNSLEEDLKNQGKAIEEWVELSERTFNFARFARLWFAKGDSNIRRAIFACLGSDFLLKDQNVLIEMRKPFKFIFEGLSQAEDELKRLEPAKMPENVREFNSLRQKITVWSG